MGELVNLNVNYVEAPYYSVDVSPDVLTDIYRQDINLAIYKRAIDQSIQSYADKLVKLGKSFGVVEIMEVAEIPGLLSGKLPAGEYKQAFVDDVSIVCDMFAVLFDLDQIGFRLTVLEQAMCPRFHVDNIQCRLLTTYGDPGTEWLSEDNIDRNKLGKGNQGLPDNESGIYYNHNDINIIEPYSIALLKGEAWPENKGRGLVHRSPDVKQEARLLLSLDIV